MPSKLRHLVLLAFKASTSAQDAQALEALFSSLWTKIDAVAALEHGTNVSPEQLARGFTHCFLLTFKNEKERDAYLAHPAHGDFSKKLEPHLAKLCVVDYWTNDQV